MGRINNKNKYNIQQPINLHDYLIGTDVTTGKTKTFKVEKIIDFVSDADKAWILKAPEPIIEAGKGDNEDKKEVSYIENTAGESIRVKKGTIIENPLDLITKEYYDENIPDLTTTKDITSDVVEGGIKEGDVIPAGTTLDQFIEKFINKTYYPTFTAPSFTMSNNEGTREIGEVINVTLNVNFNRGAINLATSNGVNVKQNDRAGAAIEYTINGVTSTSNTLIVNNYKVASANNFTSSVSYGIGPQPKDSKGNDYQTPLSAGLLGTNTNFSGYYKRFYGPNDGTKGARDLPNNALDNAGTTFNLSTGTTYRIFDLYIPSNRTLTEVLDLDALNVNITEYYIFKGNVQVPDASGVLSNYKHYRMTNDIPYGENHRHQIKL